MHENKKYFIEAGREAEKSPCLRDKCGAVIVLDEVIIGRGFNGPHLNDVAYRKCELYLTNSSKPKADRTCCIHAEWRAILDAVRNKKDITDGTMYFTRVNSVGELLKSGAPYCTVCSRLALDTGLKAFALWHISGVKIYDTFEYNELSYNFHLK